MSNVGNLLLITGQDCIATNSKFGLKTTIGSLALKDSEPGKTSSIIDKVLVVILRHIWWWFCLYIVHIVRRHGRHHSSKKQS